MAGQYLPCRHGRRVPHRGRDLCLAEYGRRLRDGELDQAGEPRRARAHAHRHARQRRTERRRPEGRPHSDDRSGLRHPPSHPRHGDRAAREPRIHHHQALSSHHRRARHRTSRRCRPIASVQSLQALFRFHTGRRQRRGRGRAAGGERQRGRGSRRDPAAIRRGRAQARRRRPAGGRGCRDLRLCRGRGGRRR